MINILYIIYTWDYMRVSFQFAVWTFWRVFFFVNLSVILSSIVSNTLVSSLPQTFGPALLVFLPKQRQWRQQKHHKTESKQCLEKLWRLETYNASKGSVPRSRIGEKKHHPHPQTNLRNAADIEQHLFCYCNWQVTRAINTVCQHDHSLHFTQKT